MRAAPAGWAVALLAWPASAQAGIADTVGFGPRAMALGGAVSAGVPGAAGGAGPGGPGPEAIRYNPALLADDAGGNGFFADWVFARPSLRARAPDGSDLALAAPARDTAGLLTGGRGSWLEGRLAVGVAVWAPGSTLFAWNIHPDEDPQWAFFTDRAAHVDVHLGLGWRALPWLSVGAGVRGMFATETITRAQVEEVAQVRDPETGESRIQVGTTMGEDVSVYGRAAPTVGARADLGAVAVGLAWRGELFVDDWGRTQIMGAPGLGEAGYAHRFAHYFEPDEVAAAASVVAADGLTLSAEATWTRWSAGLTSNQTRLGDTGRMGDTVTVAGGLRWQAGDGARALAGYRFVPSPLDNFGGPTNLLDGDRHVVSAGLEWAVGEGATAVWAVQVAVLPGRSEAKDWRRFPSDADLDRNPGRDGYTFGGAVAGTQVGVELSW